MVKERGFLQGMIRVSDLITQANFPLLHASITCMWDAAVQVWFNGPGIASSATQWHFSMKGLLTTLNGGFAPTVLEKSPELRTFKVKLQDVLGWLAGTTVLARPGGNSPPGPPAPPAPPSGFGGSSSGPCYFGGAGGAGPSAPHSGSSGFGGPSAPSSGTSAPPSGYGSKSTPSQHLCHLLSHLPHLLEASQPTSSLLPSRNPQATLLTTTDALSVLAPATQLPGADKVLSVKALGKRPVVQFPPAHDDDAESDLPSLTPEEMLDTAEGDKMLAQARAALSDESQQASVMHATKLNNKDAHELVLDLSCVPLSDLENGTGPFDPKSITSLAELKNLFTYPHLKGQISTAREQLLKSIDNGHYINESRVAPFRLVCS
jgi:hypothetical protein